MAEHLAAPFPTSVETGEDYGDVNSVLIGSDIYGWASQVSKGSPLTAIDRDRLEKARDNLTNSLDAFPAEARPYYETLVELATATLGTRP
jgi:hypothetical protein